LQNQQSYLVQKVHRLGKSRTAWLSLPLALLITLATLLLWPQTPSSSILVAQRDLAAGSLVSAADFQTRSFQIGDSASLYLAKLPGRSVLVTRISAGQLLPRNALTPNPAMTRLSTMLQFKDPLPTKLRVGAAVDVWSTANAPTAEPVPTALECLVGSLATQNSLGQQTTIVEVECLSEYLPALLKAKASGASIALVLQPTLQDQ
jgi:hypothetical protein